MNTAFITGHRCIRRAKSELGVNQLTDIAIDRGINTFLTGMAIGTDQAAARVWSQRGLSWKAIQPCKDQEKFWNTHSRKIYLELLNNASEIKILYPEYSEGVMQARNLWMVKHSDLCLAVWDGRTDGGTYLTIEMAREAKLPLIIFNPKTLEINCEEPPKQLNLFC